VTPSQDKPVPAPVPAGAPRVLEVAPRDGDCEVDPATRELRVVFDRPMDREGGYSVVGGGENFPTIVDKPRWTDGRTFVLPIRLKPDHDYQLGTNGSRFRNFRSDDGKPSEPYPIRFHTRQRSKTSRAEANREAVEVLRSAIDQDYSYRDLRQVDWDAALRAAVPRSLEAPSAEAFASEAATLVGPAKDVHLYFKVGEKIVAPPLPAVAKNFDMESLRREVTGFTRRNQSVFSGKFPDGITYLLITGWALDVPRRWNRRSRPLVAAMDRKD
jgi:hypothetical protein